MRRPVSAMRTVSDMVIDFHQLLVPAPAGNPVDPAPRQVNTAASNATAPRTPFPPGRQTPAPSRKCPDLPAQRENSGKFRPAASAHPKFAWNFPLSGNIGAHFSPWGGDRSLGGRRCAEPAGLTCPGRAASPRRIGRRTTPLRRRRGRGPDRVAGRDRRRATTKRPVRPRNGCSGHAMSTCTVSPDMSTTGCCRSGSGSPTERSASIRSRSSSLCDGRSRWTARSSQRSIVGDAVLAAAAVLFEVDGSLRGCHEAEVPGVLGGSFESELVESGSHTEERTQRRGDSEAIRRGSSHRPRRTSGIGAPVCRRRP